MGIAALSLVRMISQYGGDIALSAFGIGQRILVFSAMPSMVLGQAMQPILGFNYGAKRFRNAIKTITLSLSIAGGFGLAVLVLLVAFPEPIIRIFTSDPDLVVVATNAARLLFLSLPLFSIFNVGQMVFPSVGKVLPTLIVSTVPPLLFLAPLALLLPVYLGVNGVWLAFPGSDALGFILVLSFVIPLVKKFRKEDAEKDSPNKYAEPVPQP